MSLADWSNFPPCAAQCHVNVWTAQQCTLPNACGCGACMCFLNSCLCSTSSWAEAVAECIGSQCGAAAVTTAVGIAYSGCLSDGYGFPVPTAQLLSIGLAAISSSSNVAVTSPKTATTIQTVTTTPPATPTLNSASTTPEATIVSGGSTTTTLYPTSSTSKSSSLSAAAKAGIGAGSALASLLFLGLIGFIIYQRKQAARLRKSNNPHEGLSGADLDSSGKPELDGSGVVGAGKVGLAVKNKGATVTTRERVEEREAEAAVSETRPELPDATNTSAELPLTTEERQELDNRRRAAELSGQGHDIPTQGIGERAELEERRNRVHELG